MANIEFLGSRPRAKEIALAWPIKFGDREYRSVWLVRLTAAEVGKWQKEIEAVLAGDANASVRFPIFRDGENGEPIPNEVLENLDADDDQALQEAALSFIPRRFRGAESAISDPAAGAPTGLSSEA
jgi:hypothetical protein